MAQFCAFGVCHRYLCVIGFGFSFSVSVAAVVGSVLFDGFTNPGYQQDDQQCDN